MQILHKYALVNTTIHAHENIFTAMYAYSMPVSDLVARSCIYTCKQGTVYVLLFEYTCMK